MAKKGKRQIKGPNTEKNHRKRAQKKRNKQIKYEAAIKKKKTAIALTRYELARARLTAPEPGHSREPPTDENTPKTYLQHLIRKAAEKEVDSFNEKQNEANITPAASYDFFD